MSNKGNKVLGLILKEVYIGPDPLMDPISKFDPELVWQLLYKGYGIVNVPKVGEVISIT